MLEKLLNTTHYFQVVRQ